MRRVLKRVCKCERPLVQSPTNPKVWICAKCFNQKANCRCEPAPKMGLMEALKNALRAPDHG